MTSEELLKEQFGNTLHFKVPENYFQNFNKEMMEKIAREEESAQKPMLHRTATIRRLRPLRWVAAACVVGMGVLVLNKWIGQSPTEVKTVAQPSAFAETIVATQQDDLDETLDYYMIDENEAYDLLAEF